VRIIGLLFLCAISCVPTVRAANCIPDLLSNYIALGAIGCEIGNFTVKDFAWTNLGGIAISDAAVQVTPSIIGLYLHSLRFSSSQFAVSGQDSIQYLLGYTWDPDDIRSLEDVMSPNSPVAPGTAMVTTDYCEDSEFIAGVCPTTLTTLTVFDFDTSSDLFDSAPFTTPVCAVDVRVCVAGVENTIELYANGSTSDFEFFENHLVTVPEPSTWGGGLLAIALALRGLRLKRR
jgi:hypothetical protein